MSSSVAKAGPAMIASAYPWALLSAASIQPETTARHVSLDISNSQPMSSVDPVLLNENVSPSSSDISDSSSPSAQSHMPSFTW